MLEKQWVLLKHLGNEHVPIRSPLALFDPLVRLLESERVGLVRRSLDLLKVVFERVEVHLKLLDELIVVLGSKKIHKNLDANDVSVVSSLV